MINKYDPLSRNNLHILQWIVFISVILYFGKDIFIPLSFAMLISFVIYPVCVWMEKKGISRMVAILIIITLLMIFVLGLVLLLIIQFMSFLKEWPQVQGKLVETFEELRQSITSIYGITAQQQREWAAQLLDQSGTGIMVFLQRTISASAFSGVLFVLIPVYVVLILYYRRRWLKVIQQLLPNERNEDIKEMLLLTVNTYYNFIKGMAVVYIIVGVLNSIGLLLLGVPHAILFGFIASILTFIPYIGIIIGSLLPITMAWVTYDSVWYPVGIIGIFAFVQYLEANVIFPLSVSSRLNVNTLVMLIAIFAGGILWGVAGMILFVPFVGILKLMADHNPRFKILSSILGNE